MPTPDRQVDAAEVERLLEDMRMEDDEAVRAVLHALRHRPRHEYNPDIELLEAVARDPSLFRAVELRRAELLREQDFLGGVASR